MRWGALFGIAVVLLGATASGEIVTRYDFTGNAGSETSETAFQVAPNVTASALTRGAGLSPASGGDKDTNSFASRDWVGPQANDFLTFTVTPTSGFAVRLDNMVMGVVGNNASRSLVLRSSLDNYSSNLGSVLFSTTAVDRTMTFGTPLTFTSPVTFRLIATGVQNNGSIYSVTSRLGTSGLVLNGQVAAVPEPSSIALLALTGIGAAGTRWWRRRSRK